ncbi:MAG: hypoxanthine phosphoribosyltransferase [Bacteroidetes bacterium]|nr:MAG: hypoxanthine phosphoribosyltransferase [Bacteroidota bacterium]
MKEIVIKDKRFNLYISPKQIRQRLDDLSHELNKAYHSKNPVLLIVLNGAFIFAADLIRALEVDPQTQFIRISSYEDEMQSSGKVRQVFGQDMPLTGRHVLIVEDIVDTGHTARYLRELLQEQHPASVAMVSLLFKPEAFEGGTPPEYVGFEIPPDFVVGYGLDYAQLGRELQGIYRLAEGG